MARDKKPTKMKGRMKEAHSSGDATGPFEARDYQRDIGGQARGCSDSVNARGGSKAKTFRNFGRAGSGDRHRSGR